MKRLSALVIGALALGMVLGSAKGPWPTAAVVRADEASPCSSLDAEGVPLSQREILPSQMRICETAVVSTTVRAACGDIPLHILLSADRSGSMIGQPWQDAVAAATELVRSLDLDTNPATKVGLVTHGINANVDVRLTNDGATVVGRMRGMSAGGEDNLPQSIDYSRTELVRGRPRGGEGPQPFDVMVLLTDGGQTFPPDQAVRAAGKAKGADILVVAVCIANAYSSCPAVRQMASSPRYYFETQGTSGLVRVFGDIAKSVREISLRQLDIKETVPYGLSIVPDSVDPPADVDRTGRTLSWEYRFVPSTGVTYTYKVVADSAVTYTLAPVTATFRDSQSRAGDVIVPSAVLTVTGSCDSEFPTATPTYTPTPTPTLTPTATNTPTPPPGVAYLPILGFGRCLVRDRPVDVVLAVDASTSMQGRTPDGVIKLEAARAGAHRFVAGMTASEQAAILSFSDGVTMHHGLTADRAALGVAIDAIVMAPYTRLDLAIRAADQEFDGPGRQKDSNRVLVLLTDGRPTHTTPEEVLAAAQSARDAGIVIFTIGLGDDVDPELLKAVAGAADRYYAAAGAADVDRIYGAIRETLPCK